MELCKSTILSIGGVSMEHSYRQFQMDVIALSPIHVGSGEKYTAREFIYKDGKYYFPDMGLFYQEMIRLGLDKKFEHFLLASNKKGIRLNHFLDDNRVNKWDFGGYSLQETSCERDRSTPGNLNDISKFMRDGLEKPYVPGSSLKGAIRTILLNTYWKEEYFIKYLKNKAIEDRQVIAWGPAKKGKKLDDIFHEIRVSDSQPLLNEDLIIVQKWDYSARNGKNTPLPLYRESLKPFTRLTFMITTTSDRAYYLIQQLEQFANQFYGEYKSFFLDEQSKPLYVQNNVQYPLYLGAGSGVWTKTIIHQANGIVQKRYEMMKMKMIGKGVAKLTKAPEKKYRVKEDVRSLIQNSESLYEMGKACFMIKEI